MRHARSGQFPSLKLFCQIVGILAIQLGFRSSFQADTGRQVRCRGNQNQHEAGRQRSPKADNCNPMPGLSSGLSTLVDHLDAAACSVFVQRWLCSYQTPSALALSKLRLKKYRESSGNWIS